MYLSLRGPDGRQTGFTLPELLIAMAVMLYVTAGIVRLVADAHDGLATQPELADMQQRLRVAADMIHRDLLNAGAGLSRGPAAGSLTRFLPAIRPARRGLWRPDGELSWAPDRISILRVPDTEVLTTLARDLDGPDDDPVLETWQAGCPTRLPCGFALGMRALIFDAHGPGRGYDVFTVTGASAGAVQHGSPNRSFSARYDSPGTWVAEVEQRVYYRDASTDQLRLYDGYQSDLPLIEHVVGLEFTYYADPRPDSVPPPAPGEAGCAYQAGDPPIPLLADLGGAGLRALEPSQLVDGPVCGIAPNRFDADLLRVRRVRVAIRVRVAPEHLRGRDTHQFAQPGRAISGRRMVPDLAVVFDVAPRNLNLRR